MTTNSSSQLLLHELMHLAEADFRSDRRSEARLPFFRSVSVRVDDYRFSAFIREISLTSIGLLHNMELPLKEVEITVAGQRQGFRARIVRCEPSGEGWYISGGQIVDSDELPDDSPR